MKRTLLLAACAAACLAWPAATFAADQGGRPGAPDAQDQPHEKADSKEAGKRAAPRKPNAPAARAAAPAAAAPSGSGAAPNDRTRQVQQRGAKAQRRTQGAPDGQTPAVARQAPPAAARTPSRATVRHAAPPAPAAQAPQQAQQRRAPSPTPGRAQLRPPQNLPALGDWNRAARGPDRDRAGDQWRQGHRGWDSNALWRRDSNWWRHDSGFRLFRGPRIGFFFFPEWGYISAPQQYRDHYWRAGEYLPNWFWKYQVRSYWRYGLPRPPEGCVWVWLDGDVALIDQEDGYIIDIVHNLW